MSGKIKQILVDDKVCYSTQYTNVADADKWYAKQIAKKNFIPTDHTVKDIDDPEDTKRAQVKTKWEAIADPAVKALLKPLLKEYMDN